MKNHIKSEAFRKLGFDKNETKQVVDKLNLLLCNYHVHYQKLRNFHWNVKGPDFFDIHEKFEEFYDNAKENIDDIAERIRVFGHTPISTMKEYLEHSEIKEESTDVEADIMVEKILEDFRALLGHMVDVHESASEIGDLGTLDMMEDFMKELEMNHWMMTSFLNK